MHFKSFNLLSLLLLLFTVESNSQNKAYFEVIPDASPASQIVADLEGAKNSATAIGDIDGDNDLDLFVMGSYSFGIRTSKIYLNDGYGNYTRLLNDSIENLEDGDAVFGDIDGDHDLDLIISGNNSSNLSSTKMYRNDGKGKFTEQSTVPFPNVRDGSLNLFDVEGDGDLDLLVTGETSANNSTTELYLNNGLGNFTTSVSHNFVDVRLSAAKIIDIDNDNDLDVFIIGYNQSFFSTARLYTNNGTGTFSYKSNTITGVYSGDIDFADVDNDSDLDLILTGNKTSFSYEAALYLNDSTGNFTAAAGTPFVPVQNSSVEFIDVDNDNDMDILIGGYENTARRSTKLYLNDSLGQYTYDTSNYFAPIESGSISIADIDDDQDDDVLITGTGLNNLGVARIYTSNNAGVFSSIDGSQFDPLNYGTSDFVDFDNDGDLDLITSGDHRQLGEKTFIYLNDSNGIYTELINHGIEGVLGSSVDYADVDNDGDTDVLICGTNSSNQKISKLYYNNGAGLFTLSTSSFDGVQYGVVKFADIDNDNDEDIFIAGSNSSNQRIAKFYINNGTGSYTLSSITNVSAFNIGDAEFFDIDNDNDLDLLISGLGNGGVSSQLYRNNSGNFSLITGTPFRAMRLTSITVGDVDNDNDLDVLLMGQVNSILKHTDVYINNGTGSFTIATSNQFTGLSDGDAEFADFDNDSDLDILISGSISTSENRSELYVNDGSGNFNLEYEKALFNVYKSSISVADIDNDQDLDMVISGIDTTMKHYATLYRNIYCNDYMFDTATVCHNYTWFNGQTFTRSTFVARDTVPNQSGCDSIVRLHLTVNYADTIIDSIVACNSYQWINNITYTSSNDTTSVLLTNSRGCDSLVKLKLTVNYGETVIDTIRACNSYRWRNNVLYTWTNDTANVVFTNSSGCDSTYYLDLTIDSLDVSVNQNIDTLTALNSNANYQWLDCHNGYMPIMGADSQTYISGTNGVFALQISDSICTDTTHCFVVYFVGLEENSNLDNLKIYPNPTQGDITIDFNYPFDLNMNIFDVDGRLIKRITNFKSGVHTDLLTKKGVYYIEIESINFKKRFKLIKI